MNSKKSLLYTIQHPSQSKTHFLFGTMHLATADAFVHFDLGCKYMTLCSNYIGEMDLSGNSEANLEHPFSFEREQSLCDYISFKKLSKYSHICNKAFGFDLTNYLKYKPMFILAMITENLFIKNRAESLDLALTSHAIRQGLEIGGLETYQEQMGIARQIPIEYQLKSLKDALSNVSKFRRDTKTLSKAYAMGNLKLLAKKSNSSMGNIKSIMLYDRNVIMAGRMIEKMLSDNEGASFFSLGAGHICGSHNVIKLLAQQGFVVKPIFQ